MFSGEREHVVAKFYERWKSAVFRFCLLLTGNEMRANESTEKAFLDYLRHGGELCLSELPPHLLRFAFEAAQESFAPPQMEFRLKTFQYQIFLLPLHERTAFIIRHILGLPMMAAAFVLQVPPEEIKNLCFQALLKLRASLPKYVWRKPE
jgi:DNA-directed RNA polymerase specialized sigma24 family protein